MFSLELGYDLPGTHQLGLGLVNLNVQDKVLLDMKETFDEAHIVKL